MNKNKIINEKIIFWIVLLAVVFFGYSALNNQAQVSSFTQQPMTTFSLQSSAFGDNEPIPTQYTCDGVGISPPLEISNVPDTAKYMALIVDDPDAPNGTWVHWVAFNIPSNIRQIDEGVEPQGVSGNNSWPKLGYGAPCPPSGTHHYHFKLYALDVALDLPRGSTKADVEKAMAGHVVGSTELIGLYTHR